MGHRIHHPVPVMDRQIIRDPLHIIMYIYIWGLKFNPDVHPNKSISSAGFFRGLPPNFRGSSAMQAMLHFVTLICSWIIHESKCIKKMDSWNIHERPILATLGPLWASHSTNLGLNPCGRGGQTQNVKLRWIAMTAQTTSDSLLTVQQLGARNC